MGRPPRAAEPGFVYHVLNRANARQTLFCKDADYQAFLRVLGEARDHFPMRLLAFCVMPNHWHLLVWPDQGQDLSGFVGWLTLTHTQRWHAHYHTTGAGHLYQGRFKAFPVEEDDHLLAVCRYVERNALRAGLVGRAEDWPWCSLWLRRMRPGASGGLLSPWPVPYPEGWAEHVNAPQSEAELAALRHCVKRGRPFGGPDWVTATADRLRLGQTLKPRGRPRKRGAVGSDSRNGS